MEYQELREKFTRGTIIDMSRRELEEFITALTKERLTNANHETTASIMIATAQTLLSVRCSQELNNNSVIVARLSLFVSLAGLILAGVTVWLNYSR